MEIFQDGCIPDASWAAMIGSDLLDPVGWQVQAKCTNGC
jgi:hypothetical protein